MTPLSKARIRICLPFVGDDVGGSHISALKLIENLDPTRYEPIIVLHETRGPLAAYLDRHGYAWSAAPEGDATELRARFTLMLAVRRFLTREAFDIVHTNDGRIHALWGPAAFGTRCRQLWHHRGDPTARGVNRLAPLLADHLVTVSRFAFPKKPWPFAARLRDRWTVVHSPFDHPPALRFATKETMRKRAHARLCAELGLPEETRFIGYFGLLVGRKRPQWMADIVATFAREHPDVPLHAVLFGRCPPDGTFLDRATLERAKALGVTDRVHLMGFREDVEDWMRGVDILTIPALDEPFGRTLIEAMLLETPVVATRHGGNAEAIENDRTGYLVDADDPAAFVGPLHALLEDGLLRMRITRTARETAASLYGTDRHVSAITGIYDELMRRRTPRAADLQPAEVLR